jgi:exopolysaccharide production protein ExoZ
MIVVIASMPQWEAGLTEQGKLPGLQIARAMAALIIAYIHSYHITMPFPPGTAYPIPYVNRFPAVELFFAISGFVICMIATKPSFRPLQFLARRVFRLYPLWIAAVLIYLHLCNTYLGYPERHTTIFIGYSLTLLPTEGYPFLDIGWSLQHEIAFYLLAASLMPRFGLLGLSAFLCLGVVMDHTFTLPWYFHQYASNYPNFLAGIAAFALNRHLKSLGFWIPFASGTTLLLLLTQSIGTMTYPPALFLILVGLVNIRTKSFVTERAAVLLGDASYSIYLIHPLVYGYVYAKLQPPLPPIWSQEFLRFGSIAIVCVLAIVSWKLFESPFIWIGNWLTSNDRKWRDNAAYVSAREATIADR